MPQGADPQNGVHASGLGAAVPEAARAISISVVIPAYNEEEGLERAVSAAREEIGRAHV